MTITVFNLNTGEERIYTGISPKPALICAYEQEKGNYNTWQYDKGYEFIEGKKTIALGEWCILK